MANVFGSAGQHAGRQSVAAFKRMFLTVLIVAIIAAFCEGAVLTGVVLTRGGIAQLVLAFVIAFLLFWLLRHASQRINAHETERLNWRKGALGEYEVGAELERLSDDYAIFNNVNTAGFGNFDHIVVGPTGLFAIETKNWNGLISANGAGELTRNGKDSSTRHVHNFFHRVMMLREQIVALTHSNDAYIRAVMVFPKAHVEAQFGATRYVHCIALDRLHDYIGNEQFSQKLSRSDIDQYFRALHGIARMDEEFHSTSG
ncbi:MAG TPA: nuclease-related domain-containing protein [Candidatus Udaeobacter sp.]|nr:nuclease-related domain-containing protein [Candidatus Udaeobacter sp.]